MARERKTTMKVQLTEWADTDRSAGQKVTDAWETAFQAGGKVVVERADEIHETARITEAQTKHEAELLRLENVVGVAASLKVTAGKPTKKWALAVLVEQKLPKSDLSAESVVPSEVDGVPTDVVEVGRIEPLLFNARVRPALPGYSIGHHNITAGTFGCLVHDIRRCCCRLEKDCCCAPTREECPGDYLILSNNHVLADVNRGKPGDLILQPGPFDGGVFPADGVATLERFEPIVFGMSGYNLVDAAVARPTFGRNVIASIIGLLIPRGIDQALVGNLVVKVGLTTQVTQGRVLAVNATIAVNYPVFGPAWYHHQILTTPMSAGGDSGSLLMNSGLSAVGLLFAGSPFITIHNHIADVEFALGVRPVTAPR
jgi:hypothetical protein